MKIYDAKRDKTEQKVYIQRTASETGPGDIASLSPPETPTELSACLANPSPMLLSGFLMPAIWNGVP